MMKAKVTIQDSCNAKLVVASMIEAGEKSRIVGTIVGIAYGYVERKAPDGDQVFKGLSGQFEVIPADGKPSIESGVLFLPEAFLKAIEPALDGAIYVKDEKTGELDYSKSRKGSVQFAAEIGLHQAKNAAGYEWSLDMVRPAGASDPLGELKKSIADRTAAKQLEKPKADDKAAGKAK